MPLVVAISESPKHGIERRGWSVDVIHFYIFLRDNALRFPLNSCTAAVRDAFIPLRVSNNVLMPCSKRIEAQSQPVCAAADRS